MVRGHFLFGCKELMKRALLAIIVAALYLLHQDFWFWRSAYPLAFGFVPIGLFYHACYTVATALVMWILVSWAWPSHLEEASDLEHIQPSSPTNSGPGETTPQLESRHRTNVPDRPEDTNR